MKSFRFIGFLLGLFVYSGVHAQQVSDQELQNFAKAYLQMVELNLEAQKDMANAIKKEGLDMDVYHAIAGSKGTDYEPDVPSGDFEKYEKLQPKIKKIQQELEEDVEKEFGKNKLTKERYKEISDKVKQDYLLQTKLEKMLSQLR